VPQAEKSERLQRLQAVITRQWRAFNASFLGATMDVLIEKPGKLPGQMVGRSPYLQSVHVMAKPELIGSMVPVAITEIGTNTLSGELARQTRAPALATLGA
jgi:tRNA-2-methylthio-N6-dimethylallyladenosine synthase